MIYHGDKRTRKASKHERIEGLLSKTDEIFDGSEAKGYKIVLTSLATLVHRHGPSALMGFRTSEKGFSKPDAAKILEVMDNTWTHNLEGCFDIVIIDEAHVVKNPETASHLAVTWLKAEFVLLATASVLPNSIQDFAGYIRFIENDNTLSQPEKLAAIGVDKDINPFILPDNHTAVALRLTSIAVEKFITSTSKHKDQAGHYLSKIWAQCMVRRTYASPDPQDPARKVGDSIVPLYSRRIATVFADDEFDWYTAVSYESERRLIMKLNDGTITWNRKHARQLMLNSIWVGFSYIGDSVHADTVKDWKEHPNLLHAWVGLLHKRMTEKGSVSTWTLPSKDDTPGLLSIVCRGAPKLRITLRLISEVVILAGRKITIWCALPATQLLLYACLYALGISTVCYTSELNTEERDSHVHQFCTNPQTKVFIGSYFVGSTGLNLQQMCNHTAEFDSPPTLGARIQAQGRLRRIGQRYAIENFELLVLNSFQNRVISTMIRKSLPGLVAELRINITESIDHDTDDVTLSVGHWYWVKGELIQAPDPRVDHLPESERLGPTELVKAIAEIQSGKIFDIEEG